MTKKTLIILAGGASRRMGREKAFLLLDGKPLIAHVINRLEDLFDGIVISAREVGPYTAFGLPVVTDIEEFAGSGGLVGIYSALSAVETGGALVAACDMPLVRPELAHLILESAGNAAACVVRNEKGYEPFLAYYGRECLGPIRGMIGRGERRVSSIYDHVQTRVIEEREWRVADPDGVSFLNANTPEQLKEIEILYEQEQHIHG
jgi:molybdopterin-guanine dinucleotide biosynthesis protein A